ncbi:MAG: hypothetical protein K6L73_12105 [Cellvibrionaceae bacterium]
MTIDFSGGERRRFFRINDQVGVGYSKCDSAQAKAFDKASSGVLGMLSQYDAEIENLIGAVHIREPKIAQLFEIFNRKLNLAISHIQLDSETLQRLAAQVQWVSLSACGMGFMAQEEMPVGSYLALELQLQPNGIQINTGAEVMSCQAMGAHEHSSEGWFVGVSFCGLSPVNQELLIQHVVRRQGEQLRMNSTSQ